MGHHRPQFRVGGLHVRAALRDRVTPFVGDLEDAMRTATLPDAGPGTLLRIRRLELGLLPAGLSRQALSRLIATRIAETPKVVAHIGTALPETAEAVLFPDHVVAAAMALDGVLQGASPHWALARVFPGCEAGPAGERVMRILETLLTAAGAAAMGRLAEVPNGIARLGRALTVLETSDVVRLAERIEIGADAPTASVEPARQHSVSDHLASKPGEAVPSDAVEQDALDAVFEDAPSAVRQALNQWAPVWGRASPRLEVLAALVAHAAGGQPAAVEVLRRLRNFDAARIPVLKAREPATADRPRVDSDIRAGSGHVEPARHEDDTADHATPDADDRVDLLPPDIDEILLPGKASPNAGLWLLVAAMRLAGIDDAEAALDLPLGQAVLQRFASRLPLGETDPCAEALGEPWDHWRDELPWPETPWHPNPALLASINGRRAPGLWRLPPGRGVLALRDDLPFAAVDGRALRSLREDGMRFRVSDRQPARVDDLIRGLMLSTQRIVFALSGLGWRDVVRRKGRVAVSATHVDVTFDARDLDVRIRLAGLDIDPGWLPWIGRVVSFHYDHSQVRDHRRARMPGEETGDEG